MEEEHVHIHRMRENVPKKEKRLTQGAHVDQFDEKKINESIKYYCDC